MNPLWPFLSGLFLGVALASLVYAHKFRQLARKFHKLVADFDRVRSNYEALFGSFPPDLRAAMLDGTVTCEVADVTPAHPTKH